MRLLMRFRSSPFTPDGIETIVVLSPHQDDETLGCGGTVASLARAGIRVQIVFVTDGSASHPGHLRVSPQNLSDMRRAEAGEAASILGVDPSCLTYLGFKDGTMAHLDESTSGLAVEAIRKVIRDKGPHLVLLPCRMDGSSEHLAVTHLLARALAGEKQKPRVLEFPVWAWRNPLRLMQPLLAGVKLWRVDLAGLADLKARAISSYATQVSPLSPDTEPALPRDFVSELSRPEEFFFEP